MSRLPVLTLFATLVIGVAPHAAAAQERHAASPTLLEEAALHQADAAAADRAALRRFAARDDVRSALASLGIDVAELDGAIGGLQRAELRDLADRARAVERQLAGGDTIVISGTALIIALLILIVILVAD